MRAARGRASFCRTGRVLWKQWLPVDATLAQPLQQSASIDGFVKDGNGPWRELTLAHAFREGGTYQERHLPQRGAGGKLPGDVAAVHLWHLEIDDHRVRQELASDSQRIWGPVNDADEVPFATEELRQEAGDDRIVVDNQNAVGQIGESSLPLNRGGGTNRLPKTQDRRSGWGMGSQRGESQDPGLNSGDGVRRVF
jgi:hypothetical protein